MHFRDQYAGIAGDQASGFHDHLEAKRRDVLAHDVAKFVRQRRRAVVDVIGNAEAAADIDVLDRNAIRSQRRHQVDQHGDGVVIGLQIGDLAADMHVDADDPDARQAGGALVDGAGALPGNAELVLGLARGDLLVRLGVDIRVDAQRDRRGLAQRRSARRQNFELRLGLDVEAVDAGGEREIHLARRLADAGEDDLLGRNAGGKRAAQFAFRDDVGAGAELCQGAQHRLVGIRLHGIAHQRIQPVERLGKHLVVPRQGRGGIAIERRADRLGDVRQRDILGKQDAIAVIEVVHVRWFPNAIVKWKRYSTSPPSVLPDISPTRGEIGRQRRRWRAISPRVGEMSGRTEGGNVEHYDRQSSASVVR